MRCSFSPLVTFVSEFPLTFEYDFSLNGIEKIQNSSSRSATAARRRTTPAIAGREALAPGITETLEVVESDATASKITNTQAPNINIPPARNIIITPGPNVNVATAPNANAAPRAVRGVAPGESLEKLLQKYGKLKILFLPGEAVPVDNNEQLSSAIGVIVRGHADIGKAIVSNHKDFCYASLSQGTLRVQQIIDNKFQVAYTRWRNFGRGFKPPTAYELSTWTMDEEVKTTQAIVDEVKRTWSQTGVSILSDGVMADSEKMPGMGFLYGAMDKAKEEIAQDLGGGEGAYKEIWSIIDAKWDIQMHLHLHAATKVEWWLQYGDETPELQGFTVRNLSLTCLSSACERNWSTFNQRSEDGDFGCGRGSRITRGCGHGRGRGHVCGQKRKIAALEKGKGLQLFDEELDEEDYGEEEDLQFTNDLIRTDNDDDYGDATGKYQY
ncbi:hypothetical protein OROMI_014986 [Orobanche minor]